MRPWPNCANRWTIQRCWCCPLTSRDVATGLKSWAICWADQARCAGPLLHRHTVFIETDWELFAGRERYSEVRPGASRGATRRPTKGEVTMSDKKLFMTLLVLLIALLAACAPGQAAQPTTEPAPAETPIAETPMSETPDAGNTSEAVTAAAVARLAADLGLAEADVTVLSAEETEFTDGCLGLGGPAESCLQAITPGWLVMLSANGQEYEAHTDATGQQVRIAGLDGSSSTGAVDAITASAAAVLADQLGIAPDAITVVSAEETEFSDGCLGLGGPEESCLQAITPGWIVTLSADGQEYVAHTDATGVQVRIAE
jgi:hypothetical protein